METVDEFGNANPSGTEEPVDAVEDKGGSLLKEPGRPTVLVVDDDDAWRMLGREYAEKYLPGMDILEAESAEAAIAVLSQISADKVHAILSDIMMPGLSGMELARVLRGEAVKGIILKPEIVRRLSGVPMVLHTTCPSHVDPATPEGRKAAELVGRDVVQAVFEKGFPNPKIFSHLRRARRGV